MVTTPSLPALTLPKITATAHQRINLIVRSFTSRDISTGWPKKSKPPPIFQKIALKIANEIRFLRKVKV